MTDEKLHGDPEFHEACQQAAADAVEKPDLYAEAARIILEIEAEDAADPCRRVIDDLLGKQSDAFKKAMIEMDAPGITGKRADVVILDGLDDSKA